MCLLRYFALLDASRIILWSFVIWWIVMVGFYFSLDPSLWATSIGLGVIVGLALMLCTGPVSKARFQERFWESMRLFICPFLVSSFSGLVAGQGFILVFSPRPGENLVAIVSIVVFVFSVGLLKTFQPQ